MSVVVNASTKGAYVSIGTRQWRPFTFAGWLKVVTDRTGNYRALLASNNATTSASFYNELLWTDANVFQAISSSGTAGGSTTAPPTGEWFFAFLRSDGSGVLEGGYWDEGGSAWVIGTAGSMSATNQSQFAFMLTNSYGEWVDGKGAHFRGWDSALTNTQLEAEKDSTTAVVTSGLLFDLPFEDDAVDLSAAGNDATLLGTTGFDSGDMPLASGASALTADINLAAFDVLGEMSNVGVTVNPSGELVFTTFDLLADDFTVYVAGFSEIVFNTFDLAGSVMGQITAVIASTIEFGTEMTLAATSTLQRIAAVTIDLGVTFMGSITGGDPVLTAGIDLVRTGTTFVKGVIRYVISSITRRY